MLTSAPPRISLVIPAYNEERYLPRLFDSIDAARATFAGAVEVIVADNMSSDATARIAVERGARVVTVATRNIGAVRNGGVRASTGAIVATVDADHRIHPDTFGAVDAMMRSGRVVAGSSGAVPERWSFGIGMTFMAMVPWIWLLNIDTGVVFCSREDFEAVGGYDETKPIAEDVAFLWALKRHGWRTGRRLARTRNAKVLASMRKFDEHGDWHYFTLLPKGAAAALRNDADESFLHYWYKPKR